MVSEYVSVNIQRRHMPYTKFKAWMEEQNVSQVQVAKVVGKSRIALNQNLNGTGGDLSIKDIRKICKEFNISSDDFFINPNVS